jgi:enoyl-CoA hydratase/carnithine racemase
MRSTWETIELLEHDGRVLEARLNRPAASNAINTAMAEDLLSLFTWLGGQGDGVRCVALTGAGRHFCAGGDLKERRGMTDDQWRAQHEIVERAILAMIDVPMPVIAAVNGAAFGGGCELALCADFAYAAADARFALTEVSLGIIPGAGGTQNLPRAVGLRRASEILFTARPFSASEAAAWGVVNEVTPPDRLHQAALDVARRIAGNAPLAVRQAKKAMRLGLETDRRTALLVEIEAYNRLVPTRDRREGVLAFNERRQPSFEGR